MRKGETMSMELRKKVSDGHKGQVPWNKGRQFSLESREKMRLAKLRSGHRPPLRTGIKMSENLRKILHKKGDQHWNWKGGITPINALIRKSTEYKAWRISVFERDSYTCQTCGVRGGSSHADHIKPFALFPALRFDVSNGRTLCVPCHRNTDTYGAGAAYRKLAVA